MLWNAATSGGAVRQLAVSKDGARIWVSGDFNSIGGLARNKLAAVSSDGSVDSGFDPGAGDKAVVSALTLSEDNTRVYVGGHFDWVDAEFRRKHAVAFDFEGDIALNWDPEFDTSEGVFTVEVVGDRMVIFGGNFSRINRRPQPGIGVFLPEGPVAGGG